VESNSISCRKILIPLFLTCFHWGKAVLQKWAEFVVITTITTWELGSTDLSSKKSRTCAYSGETVTGREQWEWFHAYFYCSHCQYLLWQIWKATGTLYIVRDGWSGTHWGLAKQRICGLNKFSSSFSDNKSAKRLFVALEKVQYQEVSVTEDKCRYTTIRC
jgi:hypothetical protein